MKLIATTTIATNTDQITMSSIPQDATDLYVVVSARTGFSGIQQTVFAWFNNGSNLTHRILFGTGNSVSSSSGTDLIWIVPGATSTSNTFGNASFYVPNYAGNTNKSVSIDSVTENNGIAAYQSLTAGLWSNTAAITQFNIYSAGQNFVSGTTISLYTITKGSDGIVTTS
jgi:hypothetical protein